MKSLLLTVLGLVAVLKAQELLLDDQEDYSGTWYPKAMVHNGSLPNRHLLTKVFPVKVVALEGGNLEVTITIWKEDQCHEFKFVMKKMEEPGTYTHDKKTVHIEKTSVKGHYIFYCEGQRHGKSFGMGKLMGTSPEENPEAMEEFKKFMQRMGLKEKNMFVPELRDECINESD